MKTRLDKMVLGIVISVSSLAGCSFDTSNSFSGTEDSGLLDAVPNSDSDEFRLDAIPMSDAAILDAVPTPDAAMLDAAGILLNVVPTGIPTNTSEIGNNSGFTFAAGCPNGSFLYGFESRYRGNAPTGLCFLAPKCGKLTIENGLTRRMHDSFLAPMGSCGPGGSTNNPDIDCPPGTIVTGMEVEVEDAAPGYIESIGLYCSSVTIDDSSILTITPNPTEPGQTPPPLVCPDRQVVFGITGAAGWVVDRVGLRCSRISTMESL